MGVQRAASDDVVHTGARKGKVAAMTSIGEFCNREVVVGTADMSVSRAAKLMRQHHVGSVVIVDKMNGERGFPIGIVTDRDIVVEITAMELNAAAITVSDIMATDLITARESEGVLETMQIMRYKGVRRLPIVNEHGRLVGIVTIDDLLELLSDQLGELAKVIVREQAHEAAVRK
jgi:CBS domain-containing protein